MNDTMRAVAIREEELRDREDTAPCHCGRPWADHALHYPEPPDNCAGCLWAAGGFTSADAIMKRLDGRR